MDFVPGKKVSIDELDEPTARMVFGDAVYEAWRKLKDVKPSYPLEVSTLVVDSVDRENRVVTIRYVEKLHRRRQQVR